MDKCRAKDNIKDAFCFGNDGCPYYEDEVKAIPKADYEARLKTDMVAMLEQLDLEIQEQIAYMGDGEETNGMKRADNLVKDKINTLKQSIWKDNYNGPKEVSE